MDRGRLVVSYGKGNQKTEIQLVTQHEQPVCYKEYLELQVMAWMAAMLPM
jgi:hypothetical protein